MTAHLLSLKKIALFESREGKQHISGAELSFALVAGWLLSLLWVCAWLQQYASLPEPSGCQDDRKHRAGGGGGRREAICLQHPVLSPQHVVTPVLLRKGGTEGRSNAQNDTGTRHNASGQNKLAPALLIGPPSRIACTFQMSDKKPPGLLTAEWIPPCLTLLGYYSYTNQALNHSWVVSHDWLRGIPCPLVGLG